MTFCPEILAPAGNLFKLKTAIRYGANAVYLAGRRFGLRSGAENFTIAEIAEGCDFAHQHGARVYTVLNSFLFDQELQELPPFLAQLEQAGVDAVIVSDLGVVRCVAEHSGLEIHLSTQASTLNTHAAKFWKSLGVKRIVLGREVTIQQAAAIKRQSGLEVELFVHGAMCMAYSGNCTISNYTAGRDSNRGGCIQSCRFKYSYEGASGTSDGYFLSSRDLEGTQHIQAFIDGEIDSLKIEGRMKSALYVATTVRTYATALKTATAGSVPDFRFMNDEINSMSHRDYTDGNLGQAAGADSVYTHEDDYTAHTHDNVGRVLEVTESYIAVHLKNGVTTGDQLQMLAVNGETIPLDTSVIRDITGAEIEKSVPNRVVLLPFHPQAAPHLVLRKPRHDHLHRSTAALTA